MSRWAIFSELRVIAGAVLLCAAVSPARVSAQGTLTQDAALRLAFPAPLRVERRTAYLDTAQLGRARSLADGPAVQQGIVTYYLALTPTGEPAGVAYFDSHRVRTLAEVVMFVIGADSRIRHIEVLRFAEPPEYRAPARWLRLFAGRELSPELSLKRGIPNITGASLTANAITQAARRVLALHSVIQPFAVQR
jgi:Na+-translocating ferredoxin:NAD+ oxidoreductase subunit G